MLLFHHTLFVLTQVSLLNHMVSMFLRSISSRNIFLSTTLLWIFYIPELSCQSGRSDAIRGANQSSIDQTYRDYGARPQVVLRSIGCRAPKINRDTSLPSKTQNTRESINVARTHTTARWLPARHFLSRFMRLSLPGPARKINIRTRSEHWCHRNGWYN